MDKFSEDHEKYVCYIKTKLIRKENKSIAWSSKGSGIVIAQNLILTAAHNVFGYLKAI